MTKHLLARLDVIAFSKIVESGKEEIFSDMVEIVNSMNRSIEKSNKSSDSQERVQIKLYGDTVDVYIEVNDGYKSSLLMLLDIAVTIRDALLEKGLIIRGSVVIGDLVIRDDAFTGAAMVEAQNLEHDCGASFIRLSEEVVSSLKENMRLVFHSRCDIFKATECAIFSHGEIQYLNHYEFDFKNRCVCEDPDLLRNKQLLECALGRLPEAQESRHVKICKSGVDIHNELCNHCNNGKYRIIWPNYDE